MSFASQLVFHILLLTILVSCSSPRQTTGDNQSAAMVSGDQRVGVLPGDQAVSGGGEMGNGMNTEGTLDKRRQDSLGRSDAPARYVAVKRDLSVFVYSTGERLKFKPLSVDQPTLKRLLMALRKGQENESKSMRMRIACSGGFEVCLDARIYLYYEEKDALGECTGSWYALDGLCGE